MNKKLKLKFQDDKKNTKLLSIDYPKADLEDSLVSQNMDEIVKSGVLVTKKGPVTSKAKAYYQEVAITDLDI